MKTREAYAAMAEQNFRDGENCAQAVLSAFAEDCGITQETAKTIASGFGGGMGRMREVCGTVSGGILVLNLMYPGAHTDPQEKKAHYQKIQTLMHRFAEQNGSYVCRELLHLPGAQSPTPQARTPEYYQKRPCPRLAGIVAGIVCDILLENPGFQC